MAKRATIETLKQVNALVRHFGFRPGRIHIELGRDVGKGPDERGRIEKGIKDRTAAKQKARKAFCDLVGKQECNSGELERYELWKEQKHECMYCYPRETISPEELCDDRNTCQVDHILPRSESHDNSWHNKALCCTKCNQDKKRRTPFQWFSGDEARWDEFEFRVKAMRGEKLIKGYKIRNLLMKNFEERKKGFIDRNLNDTRFAARVIHNELQNLFTDEEKQGTRRILARPGAITGTLRYIWGLNQLKYLQGTDGKKERIEDERHHAVDAMVLAACSKSILDRLTTAMQKREEAFGDPIKHIDFPPPWLDFPDQVRAARELAPVARSENRRARGAGHKAGIHSIREEDGNRICYQRRSLQSFLDAPNKTRKQKLESIRKAVSEKIKDPERNKDVVDAVLSWVDNDAPLDNLPTRNNGYPIKKATFRVEVNPTTQSSGFENNGGLVSNGEIVRLDVFEKDRKFYLVPIYTHQVADRKKWPTPPNRAVTAHKPEQEWPVMDNSFEFKFCLSPYSWIEVIRKSGEVIEGYYRGADRSSGNLEISLERSKRDTVRGIGARTLHSFKKFQVDRLGRKTEIKSEKRTWHGVVCT